MTTKNPNTTAAPLTAEGKLAVEGGFQIAYRVYGSGSRTLLGLHGGPGVSARYLTRLNEVIGEDTQLVLYDQLGGGESDWLFGGTGNDELNGGWLYEMRGAGAPQDDRVDFLYGGDGKDYFVLEYWTYLNYDVWVALGLSGEESYAHEDALDLQWGETFDYSMHSHPEVLP